MTDNWIRITERKLTMDNLIMLVTAAQALIQKPEMKQKHGAHVEVLLRFCSPKKVSKRRNQAKRVAND